MRNGTLFARLSITSLVVAVFALAATVNTSGAAQSQVTESATATFAPAQYPLCPPARTTTPTTQATPGGTPDADATMPGATIPAVVNPSVYLGVYVSNVDHCGARVQSVMRNSPARTAGLLVGDVIVAVNGVALGGSSDLLNTVQMGKVGDVLTLSIQRRIRAPRPSRQATVTPEATEQAQIAANIVELEVQVTLAPYPGKATPVATAAATESAAAPAPIVATEAVTPQG